MSDIFSEAIDSHAPGRFSPFGLKAIHHELLKHGHPLPSPKEVAEHWHELTLDELISLFATVDEPPDLAGAIRTDRPLRSRLAAALAAIHTVAVAAAVPETGSIVLTWRTTPVDPKII